MGEEKEEEEEEEEEGPLKVFHVLRTVNEGSVSLSLTREKYSRTPMCYSR